MENFELFLIVCSFFTSALTAALGVGGGALLLVIMALFYSPTILIPVHGMVQLGSNLGRSVLMHKHICWKTSIAYIFGTVVGVAIGSQIFVTLSDRALGFILAISILFFTWYPAKEAQRKLKGTSFLVGGFAGFLTLFVGATGLLTAAFLSRNKKFTKYNKVSTFAACMTSQHLFKVIAFSLMGFAFAPYALFILLMVITGFAGTWVGKQHLLDRIDEVKFAKAFKVVITLLAVKLIVGLFV
jgi:uncharacterized membrane protein YfcA